MDSESFKRFQSKYVVAEEPHPELGTPCWFWIAGKTNKGYGAFGVRQPNGKFRVELAHRVSWEEVNGPIPEGTEMDHLCRVRHCVNPGHLEPVSHLENVRRGDAANKTHCPNGHEYTPENTLIIKDSRGDVWRRCKKCHAEYEKKRRGNLGVVEVWCDYCGVTHTPSKTSYANNVRRNGEYRCRRYATHLAAKSKQVNPYAEEGKKKCIGCCKVKPIEEFSVRQVAWDGRNPRCKECWRKKKLAAKASAGA